MVKTKAFMTNGTYAFLKKLEQKHDHLSFYFMKNHDTLAYYEGIGKSVFTAGRAYDILLSKGLIEKQGFVAMNHIPVTTDGRPVFEERFKQRQHAVETMPGFQAFRLLKPKKGLAYIVLTQWKREAYFNEWRESKAFEKAHNKQSVKQPAYFADRPFLKTYTMIKEE